MTKPQPARARNEPTTTDRCYNCRRRRLRCDRSYPSCHKCSINGEQCLGYGLVLRWANGPATRGKLAPGIQPPVSPSGSGQEAMVQFAGASVPAPTSICLSLVDPLLNHLNRESRYYINHFATTVCRDLVSIDQDGRNPFRAMIPLMGTFDFLEAVVIATSAMHLATLHRYRGVPAGVELLDSLVAKDRAIRLLGSAIGRASPLNQAMVLAAIVFFVNLDLIDSGKGGWKAHIEAAGTLISSLQRGGQRLGSSITYLADAMAADCLTYRILGSTISSVGFIADSIQDGVDVLAVLQRAEAHSYHCCPPPILQIILSTSRLCAPGAAEIEAGTDRIVIALSLLHQARALDVRGWVHKIRGLSAHDELEVRVKLAAAHRAAACLYILLAVPEAQSAPPFSELESVVGEILDSLSSVPVGHVLLKGTVWPTFMAGAQTNDILRRAWCADRLYTVWTESPWVCPWGYVQTAMQMLQDIWAARDHVSSIHSELGTTNWLQGLRDIRSNCLIV
ncbi:acriflavine sensitivity control protein acr-2 [Lasiosphaeria ovina]|uniref:Acriflavine sensitivity control protein acr-2 n=1 Tax=Lasiosphaeria ovina TaxID=92902 RepID=A0AAE0JRX6_9PEZI|nr:acriflavine sensitivity control protein acr-2 [Lasiosphaeria ovina]